MLGLIQKNILKNFAGNGLRQIYWEISSPGREVVSDLWFKRLGGQASVFFAVPDCLSCVVVGAGGFKGFECEFRSMPVDKEDVYPIVMAKSKGGAVRGGAGNVGLGDGKGAGGAGGGIAARGVHDGV